MTEEVDADIKNAIEGILLLVTEILPASGNDCNLKVNDVNRCITWAVYCKKCAELPHLAEHIDIFLKGETFTDKLTLFDVKHLPCKLLTSLMLNQLLPNDTRKYVEDFVTNEHECDIHMIKEECEQKLLSYQKVMDILKQESDNHFSYLHVRLLLEAEVYKQGKGNALSKALSHPGALDQIMTLGSSILETKEQRNFVIIIRSWLSFEMKLRPNNFELLDQFITLNGDNFTNLFEDQVFLSKTVKFLNEAGNVLFLHGEVGDLKFFEQPEVVLLEKLFARFLKMDETIVKLIRDFFQAQLNEKCAAHWHQILLDAQVIINKQGIIDVFYVLI